MELVWLWSSKSDKESSFLESNESKFCKDGNKQVNAATSNELKLKNNKDDMQKIKNFFVICELLR